MRVSGKEALIIKKALENWKKEGIITPDEEGRMLESLAISSFEWQSIVKYLFWLAIVFFIISVSALLADRWIVDILRRVFDAPEIAKSVILAAVSFLMYYIGIRRSRADRSKVYSNESIFFLGVAAMAASLAYFGKAMNMETAGYLRLLLIAAILYGILGLWFPSKMTWLFSILSFGSWMGAETGYLSGWGAYYFGMNYPLRFTMLGIFIVFAGTYLFSRWPERSDFVRPTMAAGLLYIFISLWMLSIFGNIDNSFAWHKAGKTELFFWSVIFAAAALAAIWHGIRYSDTLTRGFGLTFLFINLYTKYFEYFWDHLHKSIFFGILALSFWYLGSKAEKIWNMDRKE